MTSIHDVHPATLAPRRRLEGALLFPSLGRIVGSRPCLGCGPAGGHGLAIGPPIVTLLCWMLRLLLRRATRLRCARNAELRRNLRQLSLGLLKGLKQARQHGTRGLARLQERLN